MTNDKNVFQLIQSDFFLFSNATNNYFYTPLLSFVNKWKFSIELCRLNFPHVRLRARLITIATTEAPQSNWIITSSFHVSEQLQLWNYMCTIMLLLWRTSTGIAANDFISPPRAQTASSCMNVNNKFKKSSTVSGPQNRRKKSSHDSFTTFTQETRLDIAKNRPTSPVVSREYETGIYRRGEEMVKKKRITMSSGDFRGNRVDWSQSFAQLTQFPSALNLLTIQFILLVTRREREIPEQMKNPFRLLAFVELWLNNETFCKVW